MNFSNFVGVDVSKLTINVHLRGSNAFKLLLITPRASQRYYYGLKSYFRVLIKTPF